MFWYGGGIGCAECDDYEGEEVEGGAFSIGRKMALSIQTGAERCRNDEHGHGWAGYMPINDEAALPR